MHMLIPRWALIAGLIAIIMLNACAALRQVDRKREGDRWTSSDPLSIPLSVRLSQFNKKNLVPNPSFEEGTVTTKGSTRKVSIQGWEIIGRKIDRVIWDSALLTEDHTKNGRYVIKLYRKNTGELDEATGIISNYIPVIPGNYNFTYDVKINNLSTSKKRLGHRLEDTFRVKVLFYDINKKPLPPDRLNPVSGTSIDNSNKSYSFTNYWSIDQFPWGSVRGRSYNYPFSEGDVPDDTRFVRIFFGLKGNGTVWLDNVNYRYSKWNFTALERMTPYFSQNFPPEERIIPTPKHASWVADIPLSVPLQPESRQSLILLPPQPASAERTAAYLLRNKFRVALKALSTQTDNYGPDIRIADDKFSIKEIGTAKLVFSIGENGFYRGRPPKPFDQFLKHIENNDQGYIISSEKIGNATVVFLIGATPVGSYYAATTAVQLIDADEGVYHNSTIVDYPDFLGRSYCFKNWRTDTELQHDLDTIDRMSQFKLNKVYAGNNRKGKSWYQPESLFRQGIQAAGQHCRSKGVMSLALMVNPYSHFPFEASVDKIDAQVRNSWTHGNQQSLSVLKNMFEIGLAAGASTIMYRADDYVPHKGNNRKIYALYNAEDERRFINLQNAQAHVINHLKLWLDDEYPGTRFEFCPPWYTNEFIDRSEGRAEVYFNELIAQIPTEIVILWTGPTVRSLSIDMADLHRFSSLILRWPMLWDNTLYARNIETRRYGGYTTHYPGKVRMCNLFEPYDTTLPKNFQKFSDGRHFYINGDASSEFYKIKFATVADYEWNTEAYDPERSLWKILTQMYGPGGAKELLHFNDAYYGLYDMCLRIEYMGVRAEEVKKGIMYLKELTNRLNRMGDLLPQGHPLVKEMSARRDKQKKRFLELSQVETLKN